MRSEGTGPLAKAAGLLAVGAVVAAAWLAGRSAWAAQAGFSLLTLAIVIGMLAGNTVYPRVAVRCHAGMLFCKGPLLRLGIMLYGFRLTLGQVLDVGLASFAADALMLASTFLLTCWLGLRWLKMERQTVLLMGAGSSICGAAAVIATAPVLRAGADRVAVAVATVVIYGTAGIFLYPQMHAWHWWPLSDGQFGVYIGSSVHEVTIQTPLETMQSGLIDGKKLCLVSILRAGSGILDGFLSVVPGARVGHIGLYRDPETLQAVEYYFKMPPDMDGRDVIAVDPMLATGHSAVAAISRIKETNPRSIKFVCLLAAPEGIETLQNAHPDVPIFTAAIDRCLNDHGYILPGLGDAGDRIFGTK